MRKTGLIILCVLLLAGSLPVTAALAAWSTSSTENNLVVNADGNQNSPQAVSNGQGGAIIAWVDYRDGSGYLYAQQLDAGGSPTWTDNGTLICNAGEVESQVIISDGQGGAIIAWQDGRNGDNDIYAQRVDYDGIAKWTANGTIICNAAHRQEDASIVPDGAGGAIITWQDARADGSDQDIYAQRVNGSGETQWTDNGMPICTATSNQNSLPIVTDGGSGAIIVWSDNRSGDYGVFAQRVNASGVPQWTANGTPVCTETGNTWNAYSVADGSGGAILAWTDRRSANNDIYAQRLNASGVAQWTDNGTPVCTATNNQYISGMVSDDAGGAIMVWADGRNGDADIYVQRINSSGAAQWTDNGTPVCTAATYQEIESMIADGNGGAIVAWADERSEESIDIYAQRINSDGTVLWAVDGTVVCNASNDQYGISMATDMSDGAIVAWSDERSGSETDIYAQWITDEQGPVVPVPEVSTLVLLGCGLAALAVIIIFRSRRRVVAPN